MRMPRSSVRHFLGNRCYEGLSSSWRTCDITFFFFSKSTLGGKRVLIHSSIDPVALLSSMSTVQCTRLSRCNEDRARSSSGVCFPKCLEDAPHPFSPPPERRYSVCEDPIEYRSSAESARGRLLLQSAAACSILHFTDV